MKMMMIMSMRMRTKKEKKKITAEVKKLPKNIFIYVTNNEFVKTYVRYTNKHIPK